MAEFAPALRRALMRLSEKHRAVFLLHAQEGLRYREIADKLGVSMGTVMSRLFYAREKLQEMLASHLPDHAVIADGADGTKALERERSAS